MRLKALEMTGFKSFATKSTLTFDAPISAIVGPNGSGKSNAAEAFRFALGEQSIRNMRGKKGEDLIFNGTNSQSRMNKARVKIIFDNTDRVLPIDFDEVSVERAVLRDGVNEYYLNNSQVRLKDISELLASANIGSTGHNIISQGEADRILNASIKERRSMLEDALGLKIYQYKKNESERKLERTLENISQVESLRREISPHIRFLRKQVEKIEKGKELQEQLKNLYQEYLQRESIYLTTTEKYLRESKQNPLQDLSACEAEIRSLRIEIEGQKNENEKSQDLLELEDQYRALRNKKDELLRALGTIDGELRSMKRLVEREEAESKAQISIPNSALENLLSDVQDSFNKISSVEDLGTIRKAFSSVIDKVKNFIHDYRKHDEGSIIADLEREVDSLLDKKNELDSEFKKIEKEESVTGDKILDLQKSIEKERAGSLVAEKRILEIMAKQNQLRSEIERIEIQEATYKRDKEEYERELREAVVLVGRGALDFETHILSDSKGQDRSVAVSSERNEQLDRKRELEKVKIRVEETGVQGGADVLKEYKEVTERDEFFIKEISDLEQSSASLKILIADLEKEINNRFRDGIDKINSQFNNFFSLMFGGGEASLRVVKPEIRKPKKNLDLEISDEIPPEEDPEEGVEIYVNLPRKKIRDLMMLSGGERALTSIALLFAMSAVNPPPFIILDETDAALDEANSRKYGDMIESLAKHSQLILITHNRETMSRAGVMYGITMQSGVSQLLSIQFDQGLQYAK